MNEIKKEILDLIEDTEELMESLNETDDFEGGYAYIEENLRQIVDSLSELESYDEELCKVWSKIANKTLKTLEKSIKQYDNLRLKNKIPKSLESEKEYINLQITSIHEVNKKNKCTL